MTHPRPAGPAVRSLSEASGVWPPSFLLCLSAQRCLGNAQNPLAGSPAIPRGIHVSLHQEPALRLPISTVEFTFFGSWHFCPCCVLWPCSPVCVFLDPCWWPGGLSVKCSPDLVSARANESLWRAASQLGLHPPQRSHPCSTGPLAHPASWSAPSSVGALLPERKWPGCEQESHRPPSSLLSQRHSTVPSLFLLTSCSCLGHQASCYCCYPEHYFRHLPGRL